MKTIDTISCLYTYRLKQLKGNLSNYSIMENHKYHNSCPCNYCVERKFLKILWEGRKYKNDEERRLAFVCAKKLYNLHIYNGYKPPEEVPHYIITISFDPDKPVDETEVVTAFKSIKYLQDAEGCFEYNGADGKFHPHCHIIAKYKYINKFNFIKPLAKKLNIEKNFIDVKFHTDPVVYERRLNYISGNKSKEKLEQVALDVEYRQKHELMTSFKILNNNLTIV